MLEETGFTVMQESDNSLNKEYNNCVEMFFLYLKIFIFSEFSQECLNITQFLDLLPGKSKCLFLAPNTPHHRTTHSALPSPLWSDSHWSSCIPPTPPSFWNALASVASLVAWPLSLLFQVPGMSAYTPCTSLRAPLPSLSGDSSLMSFLKLSGVPAPTIRCYRLS